MSAPIQPLTPTMLYSYRARFNIHDIDEHFSRFFIAERGSGEKQISACLFWKETFKNSILLCNTRNLAQMPSEKEVGEVAGEDILLKDMQNEASAGIRDKVSIIKNAIDIENEAWFSYAKKQFPRVRGDFEHFHEDVAILRGIIRNGMSGLVHMQNGDLYLLNESAEQRKLREDFIQNDLPGLIEECSDNTYAALLMAYMDVAYDVCFTADNMRPSMGTGYYPPPATHEIYDNYWAFRFFQDFAGRETIVANTSTLACILQSFFEHGYDEVFIKHVCQKHGTWRFPLRVEDSLIDIYHRLVDVIGLQMFTGGEFLIQPIIEFQNEYRFFIVGGKIVKGTPVRRQDCVYDDDGILISPDICLRHDGFPRIYSPNLVALFSDMVNSMLETAKQDIPWYLLTMVIDIGETDDGRILPIEVNTAMRAGAYGYNHSGLLDALADLVKNEEYRDYADAEAGRVLEEYQKEKTGTGDIQR